MFNIVLCRGYQCTLRSDVAVVINLKHIGLGLEWLQHLPGTWPLCVLLPGSPAHSSKELPGEHFSDCISSLPTPQACSIYKNCSSHDGTCFNFLIILEENNSSRNNNSFHPHPFTGIWMTMITACECTVITLRKKISKLLFAVACVLVCP